MLIIAGDMNAKIGSGHHAYPECVGRYGKGKINSNERHLDEFALLNDLFLTNTKFKHKMCHRTTSKDHKGEMNSQIRIGR